MMHVFLFLFVFICMITDLKSRKIYNKVILGGIGTALISNVINSGFLSGLSLTCTGLFAGIALLVIPFIMGGLGAGDVKMLGMIGAFTGTELVVQIMLVSAIAGGIYALITMLVEGSLRCRMKNLLLSFFCLLFTRNSIHLSGLHDYSHTSKAIPYGVMLAVGVVIVYIMGSMNFMLPGFSASPF